MDNNSKSDRKICEVWRISRTTASSAAITGSKKENKEIEVEERTIAAWDNSGKFLYRGISRRTCKFAWMRNVEKCTANNVQLFPFCAAVSRSCALSLPLHVKSATRSWFNPSRQKNTPRQMSSTCYIFSFASLDLCGSWEEKSLSSGGSISHTTVTQASSSVL